MSDDTNTEVTEESGTALRSKLEEAIAANREFEKTTQSLAAKVVILENGFSYVKPEDLAGVPVDEFAAKAAEIQAAKAAERESIFRQEAEARGIQFDSTAKPATADPAISRVASLGNLGGTPVGQQRPQPQTPDDWLDVALNSKK